MWKVVSDPFVKRCACALMGFALDPVGDQKPPNVFKKWSDAVRFAVDRVAPDQPGGWLQAGTLSSTFSAWRACQASQSGGPTFPCLPRTHMGRAVRGGD